MRFHKIATAAVVAAAAAAVLTGCYAVPIERDSRTSGTTTMPLSVAREGAVRATVDIEMGAGKLKLVSDDSSETIASGTLLYPKAWPAGVNYSVADGEGALEITQDREEFTLSDFAGNERNWWDIALATGMPMELNVALGAGESDLRVGALDLDDLEVVTGAGDTTVDLTGPRTRDLPVSVQAGVGTLLLRLPSDVGVRVSGRNEGVGDFTADGFIADGEDWVNAAWSQPGPKIDIELQRGVGDVTLELVP